MAPRVAYVTAHSPFGPTEPFAIPELLEVQRQGIELSIFPVRPDGPPFHADAGSLVGISDAPRLVAPRVMIGALVTLATAPARSLRAALDMTVGQRPSTAIKNLVVMPKGLWLARELRRRRVEHVHAYWSSTPGTVAYVAATVARIPFSLTAHSWDIPENNALERKIRRSVMTRVIADDGRVKLSTRVSDTALAKVRIIHLGVVVPPNVPAPKSRSRPVIAVPARFVPFKGHVFLVPALKRLRDDGFDFECHFFGEGPLRREVQSAITACGLGDIVHLDGQLPHDELLSEYASGAIDVVVLPSVTLARDVREGIPVSLMEAMAHGVPVVATATAGIPELLRGGAGSLVPERDSEALAAALGSLLNDAAARRSLGEAGRSRVLEEFESVKQTKHALIAMRINL